MTEDNAAKRLEELNAEAEDPEFWSNQHHAQKTMRERNHIESSLNVFHALEKELSDATELIDLGEAEGDIEVVEEAEASLLHLKSRRQSRNLKPCFPAKQIPTTASLRFMLAAVAQRARLGADANANVYALVESHAFKVELMEESPGERPV